MTDNIVKAALDLAATAFNVTPRPDGSIDIHCSITPTEFVTALRVLADQIEAKA